MRACFLTGPVAMKQEVRDALHAPAVPHRDAGFLESIRDARAALARLVNASHSALLLGSGTLANDVVGAQLRAIGGNGLILCNGEFGERLVDHARRWGLGFETSRQPWGEPFEWRRVRHSAERLRPRWVWAVLAETSTGVLNPLAELRNVCSQVHADLCLDAVSAIGLIPVDLAGVRLATAVSGKGLAAYPGLAAVFHDGRLADSRDVPRYLDLAEYDRCAGVPFTHSSNLVGALSCSLRATDWPAKFRRVATLSRTLRAELRHAGLEPLAAESCALPGVITVPIPARHTAIDVAARLSSQGIDLAYQSGYLRERNWLQISLMGEIDTAAVRRLPGALAEATGVRRRAPPASPRAAGRSIDTPHAHPAR